MFKGGEIILGPANEGIMFALFGDGKSPKKYGDASRIWIIWMIYFKLGVTTFTNLYI